jgi:hypothetical protein
MRRLIVGLLLACSALPQVLLGQTSASARLNPGARVRVTLAQEKPRTAVIVGQRADTLLVRWLDVADTAAVPLARMSGLEVSTGHHRSVLKSAGMGALIGATAGALVGIVTFSPCEGWGCLTQPGDRSESALWGGVGGATVGLLTGSLLGLRTHENWERVSLTSPTLSSRPRVTGLQITLAF